MRIKLLLGLMLIISTFYIPISSASSFYMDAQNSADVEKSRSTLLQVSITNTGDSSSFYHISVSGLPQEWIEVPSFPEIKPGETENIDILIAPTIDAEKGSHNAKIMVSNGEREKSQDFTLNVMKAQDPDFFEEINGETYKDIPITNWLLFVALTILLLGLILYTIPSLSLGRDPFKEEESMGDSTNWDLEEDYPINL